MPGDHTYHRCAQPCETSNCHFCDGGLAFCTVCHGAEGTLPRECPGVWMTPEQRDAVMAGILDYVDGRWIGEVALPSPDPEYVLCEAVTAGSRSQLHIRRVTPSGVKPSGGVDTDSLCGHVRGGKGWDILLSITAEIAAGNVCRACADHYRKSGPLKGPGTPQLVRCDADGWHGVRITTQAEADEFLAAGRLPGTRVWFTEIVPREPIDLAKWLLRYRCYLCGFESITQVKDDCPKCGQWAAGSQGFSPAMDWIVVGGETGPDARPLHPDHVRSLRDQALAAGVPFTFSGWGEWAPCRNVAIDAGVPFQVMCVHGKVTEFTREAMVAACPSCLEWEGYVRVGAERAGRLIDGRTWEAMPVPPSRSEDAPEMGGADWSPQAIAAILRFAAKNSGPWDETTRYPAETDADFLAAAPRVVRDLRAELQHLVALLGPLEHAGKLNVPGLATLNGARAALARAKEVKVPGSPG